MRPAQSTNVTTLRCAMASDSVAPKIAIKDTKSDQTSSITVDFAPIAPNVSVAQTITANSALVAAMRTHAAYALPATPAAVPAGTSAPDFYFPPASRNQAPFVSSDHSAESVSVTYAAVETTVAGVSSNERGSPAFWKRKEYTRTAPDGAPHADQESLDTSKYEKYFSSDIRNRAPYIKIKAPAGHWDKFASLEVGAEFVGFNPELARMLSVPASAEQPNPKASVVVISNYGPDDINKAPVIEISDPESVSFEMTAVESDLDAAGAFLAELRSPVVVASSETVRFS